MNPPHGLAEVRQFYGEVQIERDPRGGWRIAAPAGWEVTNCVMLYGLPGMSHLKLYVHRHVSGPLTRALIRWQDTCPGYVIRSIGCFNPRPKRTSSTQTGVVGWDRGLSLHSVAAAIDINSSTNPMRKPLTTDMPFEFVKCFTDEGFTHGAGFPTPDPMHFQFASGRGV